MFMVVPPLDFLPSEPPRFYFEAECLKLIPPGPCQILDDKGEKFHPESWNSDAEVSFVDQQCKIEKKRTKAASLNQYDAIKREQFSIWYGDGSTVSGPIIADTVTVAGVNATGQHFSPVTTLSILDLAYPAIANTSSDPFFNAALKAGSLPNNLFGFKITSASSELFLGGTNNQLYTGELEYHPVDTTAGSWQISGAKATIGSTTAVSGFDTIVDSGTTLMYAPPAVAKTFYSKYKVRALAGVVFVPVLSRPKSLGLQS
ncbi:hypothetical protein PQX77_020368 [Marasmius sp. AFHP31]|nr:hypothetical protein PQX77_020368 [Marasmius sp. AFHP31]